MIFGSSVLEVRLVVEKGIAWIGPVCSPAWFWLYIKACLEDHMAVVFLLMITESSQLHHGL
jgi:hypothetical protein